MSHPQTERRAQFERGINSPWDTAVMRLPAGLGSRLLRGADLKTGRAWAIKESLRQFWSYRRRSWGAKHFKRWYFWATHSRLPAVIEAARTLKRHQAGLLSCFAHRITNAAAEGLNSRIQAIQVSARGYRTANTSKPPSTSTAAGSNSTPNPTDFPDEPEFHRFEPLGIWHVRRAHRSHGGPS